MILDKLGTDEDLLDKKIPEDIPRSYRSRQDLAGLTNTQIVEKIASMSDADDQIITINDMVLRTYLDSKNINYSKNATSVQNMVKHTNKTNLSELYDRFLNHYHPIDPHENKIVEETKEGHGLKPSEKVIHRKYFIDTHKLHNNVLEVRYN